MSFLSRLLTKVILDNMTTGNPKSKNPKSESPKRSKPFSTEKLENFAVKYTDGNEEFFQVFRNTTESQIVERLKNYTIVNVKTFKD